MVRDLSTVVRSCVPNRTQDSIRNANSVESPKHRSLLGKSSCLCVLQFLIIWTACSTGFAQQITVPDVRNLSASEVREKLAGFQPKFQLGKPAPTQEQSFVVYEMRPAPGSQATVGSVIHLTIYAQFQPPGDAPNTGSVEVPDLNGMSAAQARDALQALGLVASFQLGTSAPKVGLEHKVFQQNPVAGTRVARNAKVVVTIHGAPDVNSAPIAGANNTPDQPVSPPALQYTLQSVTVSTLSADHIVLVGPQSGELTVGATDIVVPAGAIDLPVHRVYHGHGGMAGMFGSGWWCNWDATIIRLGDNFMLFEHDKVTPFLPENSDKPTALVSPYGDRLEYEDSGAVCKRADGTHDRFDSHGRLLERELRNKNRVSLTRNATGRLERIDGPFSSWLRFDYDNTDRPVRIVASTGVQVRYSYEKQASAKTTQLSEGTVRYEYDEWQRLIAVHHPRQGAVAVTYDGEDRVTSKRWADGNSERYEYVDEERLVRHQDAAGNISETRWDGTGLRAEMTDSSGNRSVVQLHATGRPLLFVGPTGEKATFEYNEQGKLVAVNNSALGQTIVEHNDSGDLPVAIVAPGNDRASLQFDEHENLVGIDDGSGHQEVSYKYLPNGLIAAVTDSEGLKTSYRYNRQGQVEAEVDVLGNESRFDYDKQGNLLRRTDPLGNVTTWGYDDRGRLVTEIDPEGGRTRYEYNERGLLQRLIAADGGTTTFEYDERGRTTKSSDPQGRITSWRYGPNGQLASRTDPGGETTRWEYDARGVLTRTIGPRGAVWTQSTDPLGQQLGSTDPSGATTKREWNKNGKLAKFSNSTGETFEYEYDERRRLIGTRGADGSWTKYEYTDDGRISRVSASDGPALSLQYDPARRLTQILRGQQSMGTFRYDALGRVSQKVSPTGREFSYEYDAAGNILQISDGEGYTKQYRYDGNGRITHATDSGGRQYRLRYDIVGRLSSVVDPAGNVIRRRYSPAGDLTSIVDQNGDQTKLEYDGSGRLAGIVRSSGNSTDFEFDEAGNTTLTVDALGNEVRSVYDLAGRLLRTTDAKGQITTFRYDARGRLEEKELDDATLIRYSYDEQDRLVSVDDGRFPIRYMYDVKGNRTQIEYPSINRSLKYRYDDHGRLALFVDSEGRSIEYGYDELDRLSGIVVNGQQRIELESDSANRRTAITFPNGVVAGFRYDAAEHLVDLKFKTSGSRTIAGWNYEYDSAGNRSKVVSQSGEQYNYSYDPAGQLIQVNSSNGRGVAYHYSPGGNRSRRSSGAESVEYRYDSADRLISAGDEQFRYDASGNLIERRTADGVTRYQYDAADQLVKVVLADQAEVRYGYTPTGERLWREDAQGRIWYVTDGVNVLAHLDGDLIERSGYVHAPLVDRPLLMLSGGKTYGLHADALGSIRNITDESGNDVARFEYDAFGQLISATGEIVCPFTYTAREYDAATGLYYYRSRWYDPGLGRFISMDPVSGQVDQPRSLNPYVYAFNDPVRFNDPLGTFPEGIDEVANQIVDLQRQIDSTDYALRVATSPPDPGITDPSVRRMHEMVRSPENVSRLQQQLQSQQRALDSLADANPGARSVAMERYNNPPTEIDRTGWRPNPHSPSARAARAQAASVANPGDQARVAAARNGTQGGGTRGGGTMAGNRSLPPQVPSSNNTMPGGELGPIDPSHDTRNIPPNNNSSSNSRSASGSSSRSSSASGRGASGSNSSTSTSSARTSGARSALPPVQPPRPPNPGLRPGQSGVASVNPSVNPSTATRLARGAGHAANAYSIVDAAAGTASIFVNGDNTDAGQRHDAAVFGGGLIGGSVGTVVGGVAGLLLYGSNPVGWAAAGATLLGIGGSYIGSQIGARAGGAAVPAPNPDDNRLPPAWSNPPPPPTTPAPQSNSTAQSPPERTMPDDDIENFVSNLIMDIVTSPDDSLLPESRLRPTQMSQPVQNQPPARATDATANRVVDNSRDDDLNRYRREAEGLDGQLRDQERRIAELERQRRALAQQQAAAAAQQQAAIAQQQHALSVQMENQRRHAAALQQQRQQAWGRVLGNLLQQQLRTQQGHGHGHSSGHHGGEIFWGHH